ncbi:MAG: ROK family transcriptional regulator [Candidatus Puniceispirillaceae bacterium]
MRLPKQELGSNQIGLGQYNERLILSLVRREPGIAKAELARVTKLTPQTISVIVNRLIEDGYIITGEKQRGKVGKPSTGLLLNPEGVFSVGVKIGRRSLDVILMGFDGSIVKRQTSYHDFPEPAKTLPDIKEAISDMRNALSPEQSERLIGIGLAAPGALASWSHEFETSVQMMQAWQEIDLPSEIAAFTDLPVSMMNDVSAACLAELSLNRERHSHDFLYLYVGTFIGGGIVMNGKLLSGFSGNAAAIGSMAIGTAQENAAPQQLLAKASLRDLEKRVTAKGHEIKSLHGYQTLTGEILALFDEWSDEASVALAGAIVNAHAVLDTEKIVIDGTLPTSQLQRLIQKVEGALQQYDLTGLERPQFEQGFIGYEARALGGAFLPVYAQFAPDRDVFLKMMNRNRHVGQPILKYSAQRQD